MAEKTEFAMVIDVLKKLLGKGNAPQMPQEGGGMAPQASQEPQTPSEPQAPQAFEGDMEELRQRAFSDALGRMQGGAQQTQPIKLGRRAPQPPASIGNVVEQTQNLNQ